MNIQRLRNLTTGKLHTEISHVYEDLESIIGEQGLFTHMLPNVCRAVEPWLQEQLTDPRFWDGKYDPSHAGNVDLAEPSIADRCAMLERYMVMQNPLEGKQVVVVESS